MRRIPLMITAMSVAGAWMLWGVALGMALMLPREGGSWLPLPLPELLGGIAVSTLLFGACGYIFGRVADAK